MGIFKHQTLRFVGLPVISVAVTFALLMLAAVVMSGLPRPMQGESVSIPWPVCILSSLAVTMFLPWFSSLPLLKSPRTRVYFLLCLIAATTAWYFLGIDELLSKAYRRGL